MITKPSISELITGLIRNLESLVNDESTHDPTPVILSSLTALDRISEEWQGLPTIIREENDDIRQTLLELEFKHSALAQTEHSASDAENIKEPFSTVTDLEAENRALKDALVEAIKHFDLPASANGPEKQKHVDKNILGLLRRMLYREDRFQPSAPRISPTAGNPSNAALSSEELAVGIKKFFASELSNGSNVKIEQLQPLDGGASREAWTFDLRWQQDNKDFHEQCILMRDPVGSILVSDTSTDAITGTRRIVGTEVRAIKTMEACGIPVASVLWHDTSGEWLERPFTIARLLPGTADVAPIVGTELMSTVLDQFITILSQIHNLNTADIDVSFLGNPTAETAAMEQVELFERNYNEQRSEAFPAISYMIHWLKKNQPKPSKLSVVHGDYRLGNFLYDDTGIVGIIDWEQVHLGDPAEEIAFMYWALWSLGVVCPIEEFVERYQQVSGITIDPETLAYYRVFVEFKMLVVGQTGMASFYATPEFQIYYGNSASMRYTRDAQLRVIEELFGGGPTVAFDAYNAQPL